jgi:hypothetical protein
MKIAKKTSKSKSRSDKKDANAKKNRFFKRIDPETGEAIGRYTGATPKQAASKGYTKSVRKQKSIGKKVPAKSVLYLRESTRGSQRKIYCYEAERLKLDEPQELIIKDKKTGKNKKIIYQYRNRIKKMHFDPEDLKNLNLSKSSSKKKSAKKNTKKDKSKTKKAKAGKSKSKKPVKKASKKLKKEIDA